MPSILGDDIDVFCKAAAGTSAPAGSDIVANFNVNTLIDSIKQFPDLVHKDEPGFANSYADPDWKNFLWRNSALVPLGLAASGLAGLYYTNTKPQPKAKKKKPTPTTKTADLKNTLFNIRSQLPGLHPVDTAVGTLGGAALGGLYDIVRGNSTRLPENKRWRNTARRVLAGALLGGAGANFVGDRVRRHISNTLMPFGYEPENLKQVRVSLADLKKALANRWRLYRAGETNITGRGVDGGENIKPDVISRLWNTAVLDKPDYDPKLLAEISAVRSGGELDARREIMRRTFGVHTNNPINDWWQKNKGGYYSLNEKNPEYEQRLRLIFGPADNWYKHRFDDLLKNPREFLTEYNTQRAQETQADKYNIFSNWQITGSQQVPFAQRGRRIDGQVLDRFDLTLNPDETQYLKKWFKRKYLNNDKAWLGKPENDKGTFDYELTGATNDARGGTMAGRWLWENVLSSELPWISQKFTITPAPPPPVNGSTATFYRPWQFQFLRESGRPAGPLIKDTVDRDDWLDNNPLKKPHPLAEKANDM